MGDLLAHNDLPYDRFSQQCVEQLISEVERLRTRRDEHLKLIRTLSMEAIDPGEADELRAQIAALIAEVGTLRAKYRLAIGDVKDRKTCEHDWQPVSFRFETQLRDPSGRLLIKQPDLEDGRVYFICVKCMSHTHASTAFIGYCLHRSD